MSESSGVEVFCIDVVVPLKAAVPFVSIEKPLDIPAISRSAVGRVDDHAPRNRIFPLRGAIACSIDERRDSLELIADLLGLSEFP